MRTHSWMSAAIRGVLLAALLVGVGGARAQTQGPADLGANRGAGADAADAARLASADRQAWTLLAEHDQQVRDAEAWVRPRRGQALRLNVDAIRAVLDKAPLEGSVDAEGRDNRPLVIELPDPTGRFQRFAIYEAPVMDPKLAAEFPQIKTFAGVGIDDPYATIRADVTYQGFHAQVLSPRREALDGGAADAWLGGAWYIDPYAANDVRHYTSYFKRDLRRTQPWTCMVVEDPERARERQARIDAMLRDGVGGDSGPQLLVSGATLRTYRTAVACTGEYAAFHGGTVPLAQSAIVTAVNRVTGVYEVELTIRLTLVANNSSIVFTNSGTDPYTNGDVVTMLGQNQTAINNAIGSTNYDIGHVFGTGTGGVASLGSICSSIKAQGVTGLNAPTGDPFWIDYVAHEMGHQFGGNHTFNGNQGNCAGNRNSSTAFEPGSGSTIMGYAGICGGDDLQNNSDPYFHFISHQEIITEVGAAGCGTTSATSNTAPTISATGGVTIPIGTPFLLTATGSDANGDPLTYCWEQRNTGAAQSLGSADNGASPLFRSFSPVTSPTRYFPRISTIIAGTSDPEEIIPAMTRANFRFRVTARDNKLNGGGVNSTDITISVNSGAGPFNVTAPASNTTWSQGSSQTVTWSVANTTAAPVSCANVDILLSTDGGATFGVVLASNTPNDGTHTFTVPNAPTTNGRVMVRGAGNVFFDLAPGRVTVTGACTNPTITTQPANATFCSGQTATLSVVAGGTTPQTFQWRKGGTANVGTNSATLTFASASVSDSGSYDCVITNACGSITTSSATLTINQGVGISSQPLTQTACVGLPLNLSVTATGAGPFTYQWRKNAVDIGGATDATYTIPSVVNGDAGSYTCLVSNSCNSLLSNTATITVRTPVFFLVQPNSTSPCPGDNRTLTVQVGGSIPFTYQWRKDGDDIAGATSASLTLTGVTQADAGTYECVASNACGPVTSDPATVTVRTAPTISADPVALSVCAGQPAMFSVSATAIGTISYQWRKNTSNIDGATLSTFSIPSVSGGDAGSYDCVVSTACGSVTSAAASLNVGSGPSISQNPAPQTVCSGQPASFSITAAGASGFQWRRNTENISSATSSTLNIASVTASDAGTYDCVVTNTCGSVTSTGALLTVNAQPSISTQPQPLTRCVGASATFSVTASGTPTPTFQWRKGGMTISGATSPSLTINPVTLGDQASYDCVITNSCGNVTTLAVALTVNEPAAISTQPTSASACDGQSAMLSVMATGTAPLTYQWRKGGVNVDGATLPTLTIAAVDANTIGSYDCVVTNVCNFVTSNVATISLDSSPQITTQPLNQGVCSGAMVNLSVVASGSGTISYQWRKGGIDVPGAESATYTIATVTSGDAGSYDCVVTASCGSATSNPATITVDTPPVISTEPASIRLCLGGSESMGVVAGGSTPLTYQWRKGGMPISGETSSTLNLSLASSATGGVYDCVVTNTCGSATTQQATVTVCLADFNCDESVSAVDLFAFLDAWFAQSGQTTPPALPADLTANFDRDTDVDAVDLFGYLDAWFSSPAVCP